ncbi:MAG: tat pathway signal sequence, partial [Segniliparus sp.]
PADEKDGDEAAPADDSPFCDDLAKDERKEAKDNGECKDRPTTHSSTKPSSSAPQPTVTTSFVTQATTPRQLSTPGATH